MYRISPKCIILFTFLTFGIWFSANGEDTDSVMLEDLQYVKKSINLLLNRLNQMDRSTRRDMDSILDYSNTYLPEIGTMAKNLHEQHGVTRDSLDRKSATLKSGMEDNRKTLSQISLLHFILHGIAIGTIILLLLYIRSRRRKSLQYLISKTQYLEDQNEEILQKANELEGIRQSLEKTRKQQKKLKKRIKKK